MAEQRFQQFRQKCSTEDFDSIKFLTGKAEQLKGTDDELAQRIMVRVKNLTNQAQKESDKKAAISKLAQPQVKSLSHTENSKLSVKQSTINTLKSSYVLFVVIPSLLFAFYQIFWASERYESSAKVIVQQPDGMATMDSSMAILSGLTGSNGGVSDTEIVKAYIYSNDMLSYLNNNLQLRAHYSQTNIDIFSRLKEDESQEGFLDYYQKHVTVTIDSQSNVISIDAQAFTPDFAYKLTTTITKQAEWFINSIGHQLAESQLEFIKNEHHNVEIQLESAQTALMQFQQRYNLLDPTAEGAALQKIAYELEGQITAKEAELKGTTSSMSSSSPRVLRIKTELQALKNQLEQERNKLSNEKGETIPVSEILARYTDLKVRMELALQAYTSSQVSLEKSRIEAYRQLKYLITVETATHPQENKYPQAPYNITLFFIVISMLFSVIRIISSTIKELK